jgi:hypothetical protein
MAAQAALYYAPESPLMTRTTYQPAQEQQRTLHSFQTRKSNGGHKAVYPNEPVFFPILSTIISQQPMFDMVTSPKVWADGPHELIPTPKHKQVVRSSLTTITEE